MPRNPLANPLFLPVFLRVVLLILVGLAAVVLSQRRSLQVWRRSTLFLRARTWFVIGPPVPPGNDYNELVRRAEAAVAEVRTMVKGWEGT